MKDEEIIALAKNWNAVFNIDKKEVKFFHVGELLAFARAIADLQKEKDGDILSEAMQNDLEHGVKWLNEKAAKDFHEIYPALSAAICKINSPETDLEEWLRRQ